MRYKLEELVPIVAKLAQRYTAGESTSITYEKAQQLMEAVLYSIHEGEEDEAFALVEHRGLSPEETYVIGIRCLEKKTRDTLALYNDVMACFCSYENKCLYDTVAKGMAEFFRWYDLNYEPQNTILTLDYPILVNHMEQTGIDRIYDYMRCIQLEQRFLNRFPPGYVVEVLARYNRDYRRMIDNLCEIVLMNLIFHLCVGKDLRDMHFEPAEYELMQAKIKKEQLCDLRKTLEGKIRAIVQAYYENDEQLMEYLIHAIGDISVRMKMAADNGNMAQFF